MRLWLLFTVLLLCVAPWMASAQKLSAQRCNMLPTESGRSYCLNFVEAKDSFTKYQTATDWARYATDSYACMGVTPQCLMEDMRAPRPFNSSCRIRPDQFVCGDDPGIPTYCKGGMCYYYTGYPIPSRNDIDIVLLEQGPRVSPDPSNPAPVTYFPGQAQQQRYQYRQTQQPQEQQLGAEQAMARFGASLNMTIYVDYDTLGAFIPASFIGISREYTNESVFWDRNVEAFGNIFDVLGPAPVVRLGGASQDALTAPPTPEYLRSLVTLHCALGVRYIVGLPLFQNSPQLALTIKQAFDKAFANFPRGILSYELGNEPNFWPTGAPGGAGGFIAGTGQTTCAPVNFPPSPPSLVPNGAGPMTPPGTQGAAGDYYLYTKYRPTYQPFYAAQVCYTPKTLDFFPGWAQFLQYFGIGANTITGCNGPQTPEQSLWARPYWGPTAKRQDVVSGPAWGEITKISAQQIRELVGLARGCFWNEATVHYYTPINKRTATIPQLLNETRISEALFAVKGLVAGIKDLSRLRISEINSIPGGGRGGVSNTFGAALWTAEMAFELAKAGVVGVNFHWGNGGLFGAPGAEPAYIGVTTQFRNNDPNKPYPMVRAPWYGYVLFSRATGQNGQAFYLNVTKPASWGPFGPDCRDAIRAYTFLLPATSEISLTIINKSNDTDCTLSAAVHGHLPDATVTELLSGPGGLSSTYGISWGGATYEGSTNGLMRGNPRSKLVYGNFSDPEVGNWTTTYNVTVKRASAALLLIPTSYGASKPSAPVPPTPEEQEEMDYQARQQQNAGIIVPELPKAYGPLATMYRTVFGDNAEAEKAGTAQYALQPDGTYVMVNTPVPRSPTKQGLPTDGGAGIQTSNGACPGVQKILDSEKQGVLMRSLPARRR